MPSSGYGGRGLRKNVTGLFLWGSLGEFGASWVIAGDDLDAEKELCSSTVCGVYTAAEIDLDRSASRISHQRRINRGLHEADARKDERKDEFQHVLVSSRCAAHSFLKFEKEYAPGSNYLASSLASAESQSAFGNYPGFRGLVVMTSRLFQPLDFRLRFRGDIFGGVGLIGQSLQELAYVGARFKVVDRPTIPLRVSVTSPGGRKPICVTCGGPPHRRIFLFILPASVTATGKWKASEEKLLFADAIRSGEWPPEKKRCAGRG